MNRPKPICLAILTHGLLLCLGGATQLSSASPPAAQETSGAFCAPAGYGQSVMQILDTAGIQGGLIVHLGCNDGKLTAALRANDRCLVQGLDTDVTAARQTIQSLGLYGKATRPVRFKNSRREEALPALFDIMIISCSVDPFLPAPRNRLDHW